jgi:hypothetical protein
MRTVEASQLGAKFRALQEEIEAAGRQGAFRAALRGVRVVAEDTPVDEGVARAGWQVQRTPDGAELFNDVPYAGILEAGSRPHRPPLRPILEWVVRKFGLDLNNDGGSRRSFESLDDVPRNTMALAMAVVQKIEDEGTEAHWMVKNNLDELAELLDQETERMLRKLDGGNG